MTARSTADAVRRRRWWAVGVVGVVVMTMVTIWFGISATVGRVDWVNTGFEIVADDEVAVRFDVRRDPERAVECVIEAQDEGHFVIGRTEALVEPTSASPSRHVVTVETAGPAVTGYVDRCSYVDERP